MAGFKLDNNWLLAIGAMIAAIVGLTFVQKSMTGGSGVTTGSANNTVGSVGDSGCGCGA